MACVAVLVITASIQFLLLIGRPAALFTSAYGLTASAKILLLAALVALAARNRTRLTPNLPATHAQLLHLSLIHISGAAVHGGRVLDHALRRGVFSPHHAISGDPGFLAQ